LYHIVGRLPPAVDDLQLSEFGETFFGEFGADVRMLGPNVTDSCGGGHELPSVSLINFRKR
jgi:hypothetical protein